MSWPQTELSLFQTPPLTIPFHECWCKVPVRCCRRNTTGPNLRHMAMKSPCWDETGVTLHLCLHESLCVLPAPSIHPYLPDTRSTLYILSSLFLCHPVSLDCCCSRSKECWEGAASRVQFGHSLEPCRLPGQPLQCLLTP